MPIRIVTVPGVLIELNRGLLFGNDVTTTSGRSQPCGRRVEPHLIRWQTSGSAYCTRK